MLVAAPGQALRFEVPGWRVPAADEVVTGPEGVGLATLTIRTCLSRGSDWLCATWYATLDVRD
jgi:hypothetical protein